MDVQWLSEIEPPLTLYFWKWYVIMILLSKFQMKFYFKFYEWIKPLQARPVLKIRKIYINSKWCMQCTVHLCIAKLFDQDRTLSKSI